MILIGSNENEITKDKSSENVQILEVTEVLLVHFNIANNVNQKDLRVLYTVCIYLLQINHLVAYWKFLQQIISFSKHLTQNFKPLKCGLPIKIVKALEIEDRISLTIAFK